VNDLIVQDKVYIYILPDLVRKIVPKMPRYKLRLSHPPLLVVSCHGSQ